MQERIQSITERMNRIQDTLGSNTLSDDQKTQLRPEFESLQAAIARLRDRSFSEVVESGTTPSIAPPDVQRDNMDAIRATDSMVFPAEDQLRELAERRDRQLGLDQKALTTARDERGQLAGEAADIMRGSDLEGLIRGEMGQRIDPLRDKQMMALENVRAYQHQLTQLQNERAGALGAIGQQAISTPFLTAQQNRVAQAYDRREAVLTAQVGTETAYMQALSGMKQEARAQIGMIADAYTYDTEMELRAIETLMNVKQAEIAELDRDVQQAIQEQQRYWENELNHQREEYRTVLNMMVEMPGAGIRPGDTVTEAFTKTVDWLNKQPAPVDVDLKQIDNELYQIITDPVTGEIISTTLVAQNISKFQLEEMKAALAHGSRMQQLQFGHGAKMQQISAQTAASAALKELDWDYKFNFEVHKMGIDAVTPLSPDNALKLDREFPNANIVPGMTPQEAALNVHLAHHLKPKVEEAWRDWVPYQDVIWQMTNGGTVPISHAELNVIKGVYEQERGWWSRNWKGAKESPGRLWRSTAVPLYNFAEDRLYDHLTKDINIK